MNSHAWRVEAAGAPFVAKLAADDTFEAGLLVAEYLEQHGFRAGGPIRIRAQALTVPVSGQRLALLRFAHGQEIDVNHVADLRTWGATMGRFHGLLRQVPEIPSGIADTAENQVGLG